MHTKLAKEDRVVTIAVYVFLSVVLVAVAYPLYFVVIASISDPTMVPLGRVWIIPRDITFEGYQRIFTHEEILTG